MLHSEDEGALVFCWNCGAPQVHLSEELREQVDRQIAEEQPGAATTDMPAPPADPDSIVWKGALQCAGFAGAVAAALVLCSLVLPPLGVLTFFWIATAPVFALTLYRRRFRLSPVTAGFGARLGVLAGASVLLVCMTINTIALLFLRLVFHSSAQFDQQLAVGFAQMQASFAMQSGPAPAQMRSLLAVPEFRAGILLCALAFFMAGYLLFAALTGALAGYLRSRTRL